MANAAAENVCRFRWDIYEPFLHWKDLEATFYMGSPIVTQWKATLQLMNRGINFLEFSFSLEFDEWWDRSQEIVAKRLLVNITLDGIVVASREDHDHQFYGANRRKYYFETSAFISRRNETHHLEITIQISLRVRTLYTNNLGNGLFFHEDDLRCLSRDLGLLLNDPRYTNMKLIPKNFQQPTRVHSYIIQARWNNFFALHDFEAGIRSSVETNITRAVLLDILTYMYSGTIGITWPDWTDPAYTTELFQVIDRYKLYHLYKIFVKSDLRQLRVTRYAGVNDSKLFRLDFGNDRQINVNPHSWLVYLNREYVLSLNFQVRNENGNNPWFSYSLLSICSFTLYAKVYMEIVKMVNGNLLERPLLFHERYYTINPGETAKSGFELFLACPETFGDSGRTEFKYFIRCCLKATDGTMLEQIRCLDDDTLLNDLGRFNVLSDHMHQLRNQPVDGDILIFGNSQRSRGLQGSSGPPYQVNIHRGISIIRVPEFLRGLEVRPGSNLPGDYVTPTLSPDALPIVLDYMYTGKIFTNPFLFLDEVQEFANTTRFNPLLDLVNRIGLRLIA